MSKTKTMAALFFAAAAGCTTNTIVQGGRAGGEACERNEECASGKCYGATTGGGGEGERGITEGSTRPLGTCQAPVVTAAADGGKDSASSTDACRYSHEASSCSECKSDEYCEPGSSSPGVYCLPYCETTADCKCASVPEIKCLQNRWVSSYRGTICSRGGL